MKLFDREGTPNAARIRIVLEAKSLSDAVEFISVDLIAAEQKQPQFLAMNPVGKTPVLVLDDGFVLSECTAITEYLDNLDGNPVLTGDDPRAKGAIHMMQRRVEILFLDGVDDFFHYATRGLGAALRPWRMPDWPHAHDWGKRRGAQASANLVYFDKVLAETPFLAGAMFSMADITLFTALAFARGAGLDLPQGLEAIAGWEVRVAALPCVANRTGQAFRPEDIERLSR